ncbi:NAD(P)/FAD-dependent oxidoreductase [Ureibacillus sp. GCM10028918]|uniref:NAD(P)/FAD-dependent oxidoreductase n=1 Tax=Ureibacillus sp. GCM10028918 TaxID=3273429 RepID=UPI0036121ED3
MLDCVVVGGGPSGLNASLVLARARKNIILFDEDKPRNAVTSESHGFITRDGIKPSEFKRLAKEDLMKYPNLTIQNQRVVHIKKWKQSFSIYTKSGHVYESRKVILSTGLKDVLPSIDGVHDFYGTSLFSCPFCDGWELKDLPLVLISDNPSAFHKVKLIFNWSKDLIICTNGKQIFSIEQQELLSKNNIKVIEEEILSLQGEAGQLKTIRFTNGKELERSGGFVSAALKQASTIAESLGCKQHKNGGIVIDNMGRTSIQGVYASGDISLSTPSQVINAASEGSIVAMGVINDLVGEDF